MGLDLSCVCDCHWQKNVHREWDKVNNQQSFVSYSCLWSIKFISNFFLDFFLSVLNILKVGDFLCG